MKRLRKLCDPAEPARKGVANRSALPDYTLHCTSAQLQMDNYMLEPAVADVSRALLGALL